MTQGTGYNPSAPPGLPVPPHRSAGEVYGLQAAEQWASVTDKQPRDVINLQRAEKLWRITVFGEFIAVTVTYGTKKTIKLVGLEPPILMTVPGQCLVTAYPTAGVESPGLPHCEVTATPCSSPRLAQARYGIGGAHAFPPEATRFFATAASVVQLPFGPPVNLAALQEIPLIAGSSLTSGEGYVEFDT